MINLRSNKGVTLLVLTITVIVLIIVSSIIITNSKSQIATKRINNLYSDIDSISTKVSDYYLKNNSLPVYDNAYLNNSTELNSLFQTNGGNDYHININDSGVYYVLNLSKLDNLTLNYGSDFKNWSDTSTYNDYQDLYIINEVSHQIYYPKGIEYGNEVYFSKDITDDFVDKITTNIVADVFEINTIDATKNNLTSGDKVIINADIVLNIGSNYKKETLKYAWKVAGDNSEKEYTSFEVDEKNSGTILSKEIENVSKYVLYLTILDINGHEHEISQEITIADKFKIGGYVDYRCTDGVDLSTDIEGKNMYTSKTYTTDQIVKLSDNENMKWQILDIDDDDCIRLISSDVIKLAQSYYTYDGGEKLYVIHGNDGYANGVNELNKISSIFGKGKYAKSAKSVNIDDINKITGYVDNSYNLNTENVNQTGNSVTYTLNTDGKIHYQGSKYPQKDTSSGYTSFRYYTGSEWKELTSGSNITLNNNTYYYYAQTLSTTNGNGTNINGKSDETSVAQYNLLFTNTVGGYWLASQGITTYGGYTAFGLSNIWGSRVGFTEECYSHGYSTGEYYGIRPVVTLKYGTKITGGDGSEENPYTLGGDLVTEGLKIGDYVDYKCTDGVDLTSETEGKTVYTSKQSINGYSDQKFKLSDYKDMKWQILEADKNIRLISSDIIIPSGASYYFLQGQNGYANGESELNKICNIFGYGKYSKSAKSVNIEDINNITGYVDNNYNLGENLAAQTNNNVTYTNQAGKIYCQGTKYPTTSNSTDHSSFVYYTGTEWKTLQIGESVTMKHDYYDYYPQTLSTAYGNGANINGKVDEESVASYKLLFENTLSKNYWLGSRYIITDIGAVGLGMRLIVAGRIYGNDLYSSNGWYSAKSGHGIRAVVTLKSGITITGGYGSKDDPYTIGE